MEELNEKMEAMDVVDPKFAPEKFDSSTYFRSTFDNPELDNFYVFPGAFSDEEINEIIRLSNELQSETGTISGSNLVVEKEIRSSRVKWFQRDDPRYGWLYKKLAMLAAKANQIMWNFSISSLSENIQFTEYHAEEEGHYSAHIDVGSSAAFRKISMTVQLSDEKDYEGGDLQFLITDDFVSATRQKGTTIVFPSYLVHRVLPVSRGCRRSLVLWVSGMPFV
jgi:PKHD-type hydroxylase